MSAGFMLGFFVGVSLGALASAFFLLRDARALRRQQREVERLGEEVMAAQREALAYFKRAKDAARA